MRTVSGGNAAQPTGTLNDLTGNFKIEVANSADVLTDLTAFAVSLDYESGADEIVDAATVVFRRLEGVNSLAPLMTANPPVALARRIVVSLNPGSGTFTEVFRGKIDAVDWPERFGDVTIQCRDQAGVAADTWIEDAVEYGSEVGVSLETVMQAVADDNLTAPPTLYFPVATSAVVQHLAGDAPYGPTEQSALDALRTLAEAIGWTIRWRHWGASASDWKWTVFQPSRSKTVADHTFGTSDYWDVTTISQAVEDIRNVVKVEYVGAGGSLESVVVDDAASITKYGRRYMKIAEGSDSPVNNATLALSLANAALSDLKEPDALVEITGRYFWPGEIGVDLYTFTANNKHFSTDQTLAAMRFSHRIATGERPTTKILTRGKPSGGLLIWRRKRVRAGDFTTVPPAIIRIEESDSADSTQRNFTITINALCEAVHFYYRTVLTTESGDPHNFSGTEVLDNPAPVDVRVVPRVAGSDQLTFSVPTPDQGYKVCGRMVPISAANISEGDSWPFTIDALAAAVAQGTVSILEDGSVSIAVDGMAWVDSFRYSTSLSAFPSDATVRASGTIIDGRQVIATMAAGTLGLGDTIYATFIPFSLASAGGAAGQSTRLKGTRHDFSATKTVSMSVAAITMATALGRAETRMSSGYLETFGITGYFDEHYCFASIVLPDGVTITNLTLTGYADNGTFGVGEAAVGLRIDRIVGDGSSVQLFPATVAGSAGYSTDSVGGSELTTGRQYQLRGFLNPTGGGSGTPTPPDGACRIVDYSYTYTMPSHINAL